MGYNVCFTLIPSSTKQLTTINNIYSCCCFFFFGDPGLSVEFSSSTASHNAPVVSRLTGIIIVQLCRHSLRLSTSGAPAHGPVLADVHLVVSDGLDASPGHDSVTGFLRIHSSITTGSDVAVVKNRIFFDSKAIRRAVKRNETSRRASLSSTRSKIEDRYVPWVVVYFAGGDILDFAVVAA